MSWTRRPRFNPSSTVTLSASFQSARISQTAVHQPAQDYSAAVAILNTLQSNAATIAQLRASGHPDYSLAIPEMVEWLAQAGYLPHHLAKLNIVHVAGTKGKGSTSAFISSIVAQYLSPETSNLPIRVGLFTSPHLRYVRERIQINNKPISESLFASHFFQLLHKFKQDKRPMYFRYLTLLAFHTFLQENVETAVVECGIGGEYDSTNIIQRPLVTAITSLGIDHESLLGRTLPEIAWHKAGIFKPGAVALTVPQPSEAMAVLRQRAQERECNLVVIPGHPQIESGQVSIGLAADYQKTNASIAVASASALLRRLGLSQVPDLVSNPAAALPKEFITGLQSVHWPGRSEVRAETSTNTMWFLDGAHTVESIELSTQWFVAEIMRQGQDIPRLLIFNQQARDADKLATALYYVASKTLGPRPFAKVIFTTNKTFGTEGYTPDLVSNNTDSKAVQHLKVQEQLARTWEQLDPSATIEVCRSIDAAILKARSLKPSGTTSNSTQRLVLIIGSLHLVGGALEVLESPAATALER